MGVNTDPEGADVLALIPARGGSKGVPKKNIRDLDGKPLITYSIETAHESEYVDRVVVSTDSEEIADVAREHDAEVPFMRPSEFAEDLTPDLPVFEHCLGWLDEEEGYRPDLVVHLRPTGPLRTAAEVDDALETFCALPDADSLRSVEEPDSSPYKMWEPDGDYMQPFIEHPDIEDSMNAPRQTLPTVYQTTADIGICRRSTVIDQASILGENVVPYVLDRPAVDIDTPADLAYAELLVSRSVPDDDSPE
jgi:N-acylneuraminate cytidylyltransferase